MWNSRGGSEGRGRSEERRQGRVRRKQNLVRLPVLPGSATPREGHSSEQRSKRWAAGGEAAGCRLPARSWTPCQPSLLVLPALGTQDHPRALAAPRSKTTGRLVGSAVGGWRDRPRNREGRSCGLALSLQMSGAIFTPLEGLGALDTASGHPLVCPLCHAQYERPCLLECFHDFCAGCLRGRAVDGRLACPLCQ